MSTLSQEPKANVVEETRLGVRVPRALSREGPFNPWPEGFSGPLRRGEEKKKRREERKKKWITLAVSSFSMFW